MTDDWSRLMEIDDNIAGAELSPLDTAVFLAERKRVYEKLHPETARGVPGGLARQGLAADIVSFADATAEKFGISGRHINRLIAAGSKLDPRDLSLLRKAPKPVTLKDLGEIAKIGQPTERYEVVDALAQGLAKSAADARRQWRVKQGVSAPVQDPVETQYLTLLKAWQRAGAPARRRFLDEIGNGGQRPEVAAQ